MNNRTSLHILLVLTFIFAGLSCFSYIMMGMLAPSLLDYYTEHRDMLPEQFYTMLTTYLEVPRAYYMAGGVLYALEVLGAALMWNLRPSGFHCYTLARLLLILVPLLFLGKGFVGIGDVMMALLFILVYWLLMKQLGAFNRTESQEEQLPQE